MCHCFVSGVCVGLSNQRPRTPQRQRRRTQDRNETRRTPAATRRSPTNEYPPHPARLAEQWHTERSHFRMKSRRRSAPPGSAGASPSPSCLHRCVSFPDPLIPRRPRSIIPRIQRPGMNRSHQFRNPLPHRPSLPDPRLPNRARANMTILTTFPSQRPIAVLTGPTPPESR